MLLPCRILTISHVCLLQDLVFPTEIVGKRTRCKIDGSKILKVQLDPKDQVRKYLYTKVDHVLNAHAAGIYT